MLDYIKTTAVGAAALMLSSLAVSAATTLDFMVDAANSIDVTLTDTSMRGIVCSVTTADIDGECDPADISDATFLDRNWHGATIDLITWSGTWSVAVWQYDNGRQRRWRTLAPAGATTIRRAEYVAWPSRGRVS